MRLQVIKKALVRGVLWLSLFILLSFVVITGLLRLPEIQTRLIQNITSELNDATGFNFEIEYINLNWFDVLKIRGLKVKDTHDSTMINLPEAEINFSIVSFFSKTHRHIDRIHVKEPNVSLYKHAVEEPINITIFIDTLKYNLGGDGKTLLTIGAIELESGTLNFQNFTTDQTFPGFNMNKFQINELGGVINDFSAKRDTIHLKTVGLSGVEAKTNLPIHEWNSTFMVHQKEMKFGDLDLKIGSSQIRDSIAFTYSRMANLSYFADSVNMHFELNNSVIHSHDLAYFSKEFRQINDTYYITGIYDGSVPDFQVKGLNLKFGQKGHLHGGLTFSGLPNFEETFMDIRLENSFVRFGDLAQYLGVETIEKLSGIEEAQFSGSYTGFINDFVANGRFDTNIGELIPDLNLKITDEGTNYLGRLKTKDFDVGRFSGSSVLQTVDMEGSIEGSGFTVADADFILDGSIHRLGINKYDLTNIQTNARFARELFVGEVRVADPNLVLEATGSIDLRDRSNRINMEVQLDTFILAPFNITEVPTSISSYIEVDVQGLELDSIRGDLFLREFHVTYDTSQLTIQQLRMNSELEDDQRTLDISSDRMNINLTGDYDYTTLYNDVRRLYEEYRLNIRNDAEAIKEYYDAISVDNEDYSLRMRLNLTNINPLVQLFMPQLQFSRNINIEGDFSHGYASIVNFTGFIDSINVDGELFVGNLFDLSASKISDSKNVLASLYVASDQQLYSGKTRSQNLFTQAVWDRNQIDFNVSIEQEGLENYADLYGEIVFLDDLTVIKIKPSDLQVLYEKWDIIESNVITIAGRDIGFQSVGLQKSEETIILDGQITDNREEPLTLNLQNLELSNFNPLLTKRFDGSCSGYFQLKNYYENPRFETNVLFREFKIDDFLVGDILNRSEWDYITRKFDLEFSVTRNSKEIIDISGEYMPSATQGLNLKAVLEGADLKIGEPFIEKYFSDIQGTASGEFKITGNLKNPVMSGNGKIRNGAARMNYLNTLYTFNSDVIMNDNEIGLRNVELRDRDGNVANLTGGFFHTGFDQVYFDFAGDFTNFLVLNTTINDNNLFYGTGKGTGTITIQGFPQNLSIAVTAITTPDTRIFIPLGGTEEIGHEDFIQFISFSDASQQREEDNKQEEQNTNGLDFELDLTLTRDAYAELIFDVTVGDIIRGRGSGELNFRMTTDGDFTMSGDYTIEQGGYNFTLYNIVNKEFNMLPDSRITWLGDPYGGVLDIKASYEQFVSIGPLLDTAYRNSPEIRRRYPTRVILDIQGPLFSPEISFDIEVDDYPNSYTSNGQVVNLQTEMDAIKAEWVANTQELQKQVFSLIVLKQFSEKDINTGGSVGRSVSEFVSNQLSYWISQVDENLEIDIDIGDLSDEAYNTFQMRLSYTFMEGRLRVTRDGGFTGSQNQATASSLIGDWSMEYMLSQNGNVRVRLFQEINYSTLERPYSQDYTAIQGGLSILYTQSYDEIREIFNASRRRKRNEAESTEPTSPQDGGTGNQSPSNNGKN